MRLLVAVFMLVCGVSAQAADRHRSELEFLGTNGDGLLPLNDVREIGGQDQRDLAYSLFRNDEQRVLRADTIADLRSLNLTNYVVQDDAIAFVSGYTAAGDHSGVYYRYDEDCTASDTAGTVLEPTVGGGCWRIVYPDPGKVDVRYFGAFPSSTVDQTDTLAALQRAATADVHLYFPGSQTTLNGESRYYISGTWQPSHGFSGDGPNVSSIEGITAVWDAGDEILIDFDLIETARQRFSDIELDGNQGPKYILSTSDLAHTTISSNGAHTFENIRLQDGKEYSLYFPDTVSSSGMQTVGGTWINSNIHGGTNGGAIYLGVASDDVTFIGLRLNLGGTPTVPPVRIHAIDVSFTTTYVAVSFDDMDASVSVPALFYLTSAGSGREFRGMFIEAGNQTYANWKRVFQFNSGPQTTISNVRLEPTGSSTWANDTTVAFAYVDLGSHTGHLDISNVTNGFGSTFPNFLTINTTGTGGNVVVRWHGGIDGFDNLVVLDADSSQSNTNGDVAHFMGSYGGVNFNHGFSSDGTSVFLTSKKPTIAANDNLDLIAANADVGRTICPFDATVQEIKTVLNSALATGDATVTVAIAGVNITGGVVTITQAGSAAGDVDTATPTAANDCTAGQVITSTVSGSSTAGTGNVIIHFAPRAA